MKRLLSLLENPQAAWDRPARTQVQRNAKVNWPERVEGGKAQADTRKFTQ